MWKQHRRGIVEIPAWLEGALCLVVAVSGMVEVFLMAVAIVV